MHNSFSIAGSLGPYRIAGAAFPARLPLAAGVFLLTLLAGDIALGLLHVAAPEGDILGLSTNLSVDNGLAEFFQYAKALFAAGMTGVVAWRTRETIYLGWCLLFAYIFVDDAFMLHERGGRAFVNWFGIESAFRLRAQDFGEAIVFGLAGIVCFGVIGLACLSASRIARLRSLVLAVLIGGLVGAGVALDFLGIRLSSAFLGGAEDFAEMLILSAIASVALVFALSSRRGE